MNKAFLILIFFFFYKVGFAQINYVPNPGFDSVDCVKFSAVPPGGFFAYDGTPFQVSKQGWNNFKDAQPFVGQAYIDNVCSGDYNYTKIPYTRIATIPSTPFSYKQPLSGNGYAVVKVYDYNGEQATNSASRGYCIAELYEKLPANKKCFVEFNVAPFYPAVREYYPPQKWYFNDAIGLKFFSSLPNPVAGVRNIFTYYTPDLENTAIINDTVNWTRISMCYTPTGTERYIVIGNFFSDAKTNIQWDNSPLPIPVVQPGNSVNLPNTFYIDDVIVSPFDPFPSDTLILCENATIKLDAHFFHATYKWNTGETSSSINVKKPGIYMVQATIEKCIFADTVTVLAEKTYKAIPVDTGYCKNGKPLILSPHTSPDYLYRWNTGATTQGIYINKVGTYSVTITTPDCVLNYSSNVTEEKCSCHFYAPTAFSPNGDGNNDAFKPFIACKILKVETYKLTIFDKFGSSLFQTTDINQGWDGTYRGHPRDPDNYMWVVEYSIFNTVTNDFENFLESDVVTLIK